MPHAEIEAIRALKDKPARGATIYVTLEPCSTHGRTPPCTSAIVEAGFARVVYGTTDPNKKHAGRAEKILTKAGIALTTGILAEECAALNTAWNRWIATGLPYVLAKAGMTLDGKICSPPEQRWITSAASRKDAMKLRASVDAIMVGGETVRVDNPTLTVRGLKVKAQPWRVVWSKSGRLPRKAILFTDGHRARTIVVKGLSLRAALKDLGKRGIQSVLIEGGGRLLGEAFDRQLVDEVCFYLAPLLTSGPVPAVGGKGIPAVALAQRLESVVFKRIGSDVRLTGKVAR
ncbi:bifunctional diaminohydroxyphosphoribosylaminopyrimidine deaminase/5-amino-6-(5-phosphoribosylamino)uracil reductase RibD [soil metagenome]